MEHRVILLPGVVMPKDLAYGALLDALGKDVRARAKDLELYAEGRAPGDYGLEREFEGILREADGLGFDRFNLVGYSAGGAISAAFACRYPERLLSLSLLEPAWLGNQGLLPEEERVRADLERIRELPPEQLMPAFVRAQLAPGVEPPQPPPAPPPPWMAGRPAGIRALTAAFDELELDPAALRSFHRPVLFVLGALSNPDYFGRMAERAAALFDDFTLEVFEDRHHFDPPHRIEPERLGRVLVAHWDRAAGTADESAAPGS